MSHSESLDDNLLLTLLISCLTISSTQDLQNRGVEGLSFAFVIGAENSYLGFWPRLEAGDKCGQVDSTRGSVTGHHMNRLAMSTGR